ncbi:MAG TPA: S8 family serine peptidase [Pyrinomonadaceae bacterium]
MNRTPSRVATLLALFSLLAQLCAGATAGSAARPDKTPAAKVSHKLRERLRRSGGPARTAEVILQLKGKPSGRLNALLNRAGVHVRAKHDSFDTLALDLPLAVVEELSSFDEVRFVSSDEKVVSTGHVVTTTGTDVARTLGIASGSTTLPYDGAGIGIAIVDSGMDTGHKTFGAKADLSGSRVKFKKDFTSDGKADKDFYGHGTHVASSAVGMSTVTGGAYEGIARGADILNLRVLDANGQGRVSDLLTALNWFLSPVDPNKALSSSNPTNATKYNVRVVNLSLGTPAIDSYRVDPLCRAVRALVDAGIVVVAAAGNNGKDNGGNKLYGAIHSPGTEPSVITVGATNTFGTDARADDGVATYSSRGPTRGSWLDADGVRHHDNLIKPDLAAPGNKLIYAEADDGGNPNTLIKQNPKLETGILDSDNKRLMFMSGTSMATPLVAGAAALMLQANPKLTPNMVKMILMYTAQPLAHFNTLEQGAGQLNVEGAVRLARLVRTDLNSQTALGAPLLSGAAPTPATTVAGHTFPWAQGIVLNYGYATGSDLITKYQKVYGLGIVMTDAILMSDGIVMTDNTAWSDSVAFSDAILMSDGLRLGGGTKMFGDAILMSDGIVMTDAILFGDGILTSDAILFGDNVVHSDANIQAQSALVDGDDTAYMQ